MSEEDTHWQYCHLVYKEKNTETSDWCKLSATTVVILETIVQLHKYRG